MSNKIKVTVPFHRQFERILPLCGNKTYVHKARRIKEVWNFVVDRKDLAKCGVAVVKMFLVRRLNVKI